MKLKRLALIALIAGAAAGCASAQQDARVTYCTPTGISYLGHTAGLGGLVGSIYSLPADGVCR